ncbi:MAG: hypothetical protein B6245_18605 [Desulfobacteraceae bacterium 4572_88]|nr:MAG: hypothetical protein B6245_18605 [Desulfobacteraceae bacterium 4572_88]
MRGIAELPEGKTMRGIAELPEGKKRATLFSLVRESLGLNQEEERQYQEILRGDPLWKEVKMLESIEDVGYERGWEEGREELRESREKLREEGREELRESREKTVRNILGSGWLTREQIAQIMEMDIARVDELARSPEPESE